MELMDPAREHQLLILQTKIKILRGEYRLEQWETRKKELIEAGQYTLRSREWIETRIKHDSSRLRRLKMEVVGLEATQPQV